MKTLRFVPVILLFLILAACTPASSGAEQAQQALTGFFDHLNKGEYAEADALYGGDYSTLQGWNPSIDPSNHAALWEAGCTMNGLNCLSTRSVTIKEQKGSEFIFSVEFNAPDGSLFVQGPCCGADETEEPPASAFDLRVVKTGDGQYKVMDMPIYTP